MFARYTGLPITLVALLTCAGLVAQEKPATLGESWERAADSFVALLAKGDFAKATSTFDAAMLKALPEDKLKTTWETVQQQAGAFQKQVGSRRETGGKYEIVFVTCEFAKSKLDAKVVFDQDGKIGGLFFSPVSKPKPTGTEEVWEGLLKVGDTDLRLIFHLFKQTDGTFAAMMDSPDQGAMGTVLDEASVKDDAVRLELKSANMVFEGRRDKEMQTITGELKQSGQTFPLTLKKAAKAK